MNKGIVVVVSLTTLSLPAYADQGALITAGGGSLTAISIANPPGTLSIAPPSLTFTSTGGSTLINAVFSTNNTSESCSGGGKGGHITCTYTFTGTFSGTLTTNGSVQAINGTTTQYYGTSGGSIIGATGYNSAYTPFYFTDGNARILRSDDMSGTNAISYGTQGSGIGQFYGPSGIALDTAGRIYITDLYNDRIVRIDDMNGTNWTSYGTYGSGVGQFTLPRSISVDPAGHLWVLDSANGLVRMDDMNGTNWTVVGTVGSGVGQFSAVAGAPAFDSLGRIYVADAGNRRIVRFDDLNFTNWTTLTQSQPSGPYIYTFGQLYGVAVDYIGKIYVASDRTVVRVDDMTGANWSSIAIGTFPATNIAVDASGMVLMGNGYEAVIDDSQATVFTSTIDGNILVNGVYATVYSAVPVPLPKPRPSAIKFTPNTLTFTQNVNSPSAPQTITVSNFGGSPLSGVTVSAAGNFSQTDNCPITLQAGSSCTVSITFTPSFVGPAAGALNVGDNSGNAGTMQTVVLNGTGTTPAATFSPASLSFSSQVIGTTSSARSITVQSAGTGPLQISNIAVSGPFAGTNTCTASPIASGSTCTISVTFSPLATGNASGSVTLTDNAGTQTVRLGGSGIAPVTFSQTALNFGNLATGSISSAHSVTVTNHLNSSLSISSIAATGPFAIATNTCGVSIVANGNCAVGITFTPTGLGAATGALTFTDNAFTSPQTVALSGTGTAPVTLSTNSISFTSTVLGQTSSSRSVTVTNQQTSALTFTSIIATAGFAIASNTCATSIAAGANCTVGVTFSPTSVGSATGTLTFSDSAATSPQVVNLSGTGSAPVTFSTSSLNFGTIAVNTTSSAKTLTVTDRLNVALSLSSVTASTGFTVSSNQCGTSIEAGGNCSVSVKFSPTTTGTLSGTLTFTDSALTSPQTITLSGTGQ